MAHYFFKLRYIYLNSLFIVAGKFALSLSLFLLPQIIYALNVALTWKIILDQLQMRDPANVKVC